MICICVQESLVLLSGTILCADVVSVRRSGWLDRIVGYHRARFEQDVRDLAPIQIQASIEQAPAGYVDSPSWDNGTVSRLLSLLGASESAAPVRRALRRSLHPQTRRFISKKQSWKLFPSLGKKHQNNIYYDFKSDYEYSDSVESDGWQVPDDNAVVVLRNPVEARLPSARISVKLLREIMEARANAARQMPSTTASSIPWKQMNTTMKAAAEKADAAEATSAAVGQEESSGTTVVTEAAVETATEARST